MTTHKEDEPHDPTQWPPPIRVPRSIEEGSERKKDAKLITGTTWADALLGSAVSLTSFTLLTFIIANPLTWRVAPDVVPENWSTQLRLLSGWSLACVVQFVSCVIFRRRYKALSRSIMWAGVSVASFWLLIILAAWWLFG